MLTIFFGGMIFMIIFMTHWNKNNHGKVSINMQDQFDSNLYFKLQTGGRSIISFQGMKEGIAKGDLKNATKMCK